VVVERKWDRTFEHKRKLHEGFTSVAAYNCPNQASTKLTSPGRTGPECSSAPGSPQTGLRLCGEVCGWRIEGPAVAFVLAVALYGTLKISVILSERGPRRFSAWGW